eukprot:Nk52_evm51s221 gene=Nk52_evmTU51s221
MATDKITFLLNWKATPYHAPTFLAQKLGYYADEGIKVAILEPNDPSDVTEIIGSGKVDLGFKAMIHTIAAKARGFPVTSLGTLFDEPFTGICYLKKSGIKKFEDVKGKKVGYVGEFGKVIVDELCKHYGMSETDYTAVRVGMKTTQAILDGTIDCGVGIQCVQGVELEHLHGEADMLRIDELAHLGCCCFCSILFIGNDEFIKANPEKVKAFMKANKKAMDFVLANPEEAWKLYCEMKPVMDTELNKKIFIASFRFLSQNMTNVERDWIKVRNYCIRLGLIDDTFESNKTNSFLPEECQKEGSEEVRLLKEHGAEWFGTPDTRPARKAPFGGEYTYACPTCVKEQ